MNIIVLDSTFPRCRIKRAAWCLKGAADHHRLKRSKVEAIRLIVVGFKAKVFAAGAVLLL